MRNPNVASLVKRDTELSAQLPIQLPGATLVVSGEKIAVADAAKLFTDHLGLIAEIAQARAQLHELVVKYEAMTEQANATEAAARAYTIGIYGPDSPQALALGFAPKKRKAPTAETRIAAVTKAAATRKARGTMGKRQKAKILGAPPVPATSPPAPAPVTPSTAGH